MKPKPEKLSHNGVKTNSIQTRAAIRNSDIELFTHYGIELGAIQRAFCFYVYSLQ
jgi:hypothetical protein